MFEHEDVHLRRGGRSGFPIVVAVHSTVLGPALGGCRLWRYPDWRAALDDALRLARAMTLKNATANLPFGGGKTVIAVPHGVELDGAARRAALLDAAELIDSFAGRYATGPDVGTSSADMAVIGELTSRVCCRPEELGGSGDPSRYTAAGVRAAIRAACGDPRDQAITVIGLGHVGAALARLLAADGARLTVTDVDNDRRPLAAELGARWCEVAELLHRRGILWVPDYLASAGGVTYAASRELVGVPPDEALRRVHDIGAATARLLRTADRLGISPHRTALRQLADQLDSSTDTKPPSAARTRSLDGAPTSAAGGHQPGWCQNWSRV